MAYETDGSLTTDARTVADTELWDTQSDWEAAQSQNKVAISNGVVELATADVLIDNLEWGGPVGDRYKGATSQFAIDTNAPVYEGSYSLKGDSGGGGQEIYSNKGDGTLDNYPAAGDTFEHRVYNNGTGAQALMMFGFDDGTDPANYGYRTISRFGSNDDFILQLRDNGSKIIEVTGVGWPSDSWIRIEIGWGSGGTFNVLIEDEAGNVYVDASGSDSTYTSGGFGWGVNTATTSASLPCDYARIL